MIKERIPQIDELTLEEKRMLVQELQAEFDDVDDQDTGFTKYPILPWQEELLEERIRAADANPEAGSTWEEVEARILAALEVQRSGNNS